MNVSTAVISSLPGNSNSQWQRVKNNTEDSTSQIASLVFQKQQHETVVFSSERRLIIVLVGKKDLVQSSSAHLHKLSGLPTVSVEKEDILKEIEKDEESRIAKIQVEILKENSLEIADEFLIGKLAKQVNRSADGPGCIFTASLESELRLNQILGFYVRKIDTIVPYFFESEQEKGDDSKLNTQGKELKKIPSDEPSKITSQITEFFNQKIDETAKNILEKQKREDQAAAVASLSSINSKIQKLSDNQTSLTSGIILHTLSFFSIAAVTYFVVKQLVSNGKEH